MKLTLTFGNAGVAIGAGWQSIVAYVNLGCYYIIGIPVGIVLGKVYHLQVKVSTIFSFSNCSYVCLLVSSIVHYYTSSFL